MFHKLGEVTSNIHMYQMYRVRKQNLYSFTVIVFPTCIAAEQTNKVEFCHGFNQNAVKYAVVLFTATLLPVSKG